MLEPDRALYFPNFSHFLTLLDCQSNFSLSLSLLLELDMESATVIHLWCVRMCVCARSQSTIAYTWQILRTLPHVTAHFRGEADTIHYPHTHVRHSVDSHVRYHGQYTCHTQSIHQTPKHSTLSIPAALTAAAAAAAQS